MDRGATTRINRVPRMEPANHGQREERDKSADLYRGTEVEHQRW